MLPSAKIKEYLTVVIILLITTVLSMFPLSALALLCSATIVALSGFLVARYHYGYVGAAVIGMFIVCAVFSGNLSFALVSLLPSVLCGITLGIGYNVKMHPLKTVAIFTAIYIFSFIGNLKLANAGTDENILLSVFESVSNTYRELLTGAGVASPTSEELNAVISEITSMMLRFFPAFIVIVCLIYALFCFYLFKRICQIRKADVSFLSSFSDWHLEKNIGITYLIVLVVSFLLPEGTLYADVLMNIITVMTVVFYVLGLSYIEYLLKKRIVKSGRRKLILVLIAFSPFFTGGTTLFIVSIMGLMDSLTDYRHKKMSHQ